MYNCSVFRSASKIVADRLMEERWGGRERFSVRSPAGEDHLSLVAKHGTQLLAGHLLTRSSPDRFFVVSDTIYPMDPKARSIIEKVDFSSPESEPNDIFLDWVSTIIQSKEIAPFECTQSALDKIVMSEKIFLVHVDESSILSKKEASRFCCHVGEVCYGRLEEADYCDVIQDRLFYADSSSKGVYWTDFDSKNKRVQRSELIADIHTDPFRDRTMFDPPQSVLETEGQSALSSLLSQEVEVVCAFNPIPWAHYAPAFLAQKAGYDVAMMQNNKNYLGDHGEIPYELDDNGVPHVVMQKWPLIYGDGQKGYKVQKELCEQGYRKLPSRHNPSPEKPIYRFYR